MKWFSRLKNKHDVPNAVNSNGTKWPFRQKNNASTSLCPFSSMVTESSSDEESVHEFPVIRRGGPDEGYRSSEMRPMTEPARILFDLPPGPSLSTPIETLVSTSASTAVAPVHSTVECTHVLVPDLDSIVAASYYWGLMDRYEAEALLEGKPEGTFLLRDSAQINYLFSVSFRRYSRTLHARIEHLNGIYSFDIHDASYFQANSIKELVKAYKDPKQCLFYEPQLVTPLPRNYVFELKHLCRSVIASNTTYENVSALPLPTGLKKYVREYHYKHPLFVKNLDV